MNASSVCITVNSSPAGGIFGNGYRCFVLIFVEADELAGTSDWPCTQEDSYGCLSITIDLVHSGCRWLKLPSSRYTKLGLLQIRRSNPPHDFCISLLSSNESDRERCPCTISRPPVESLCIHQASKASKAAPRLVSSEYSRPAPSFQQGQIVLQSVCNTSGPMSTT